jgi:hypothetical protein
MTHLCFPTMSFLYHPSAGFDQEKNLNFPKFLYGDNLLTGRRWKPNVHEVAQPEAVFRAAGLRRRTISLAQWEGGQVVHFDKAERPASKTEQLSLRTPKLIHQ